VHVKIRHGALRSGSAVVVPDGMPRLDYPHQQREWDSRMNWIVQRIFGLPPLTEGHDMLLQRVRNSVPSFPTVITLSQLVDVGEITFQLASSVALF